VEVPDPAADSAAVQCIPHLSDLVLYFEIRKYAKEETLCCKQDQKHLNSL
jgi:hypothetical protein